MKNIFVFVICLVSLSLSAQKTTYKFEGVPDSFYLVQSIETLKPNNPRPEKQEISILFRSKLQYEEFLKSLSKKAADQEAEGNKLIQGAAEIRKVATEIEKTFKDFL